MEKDSINKGPSNFFEMDDQGSYGTFEEMAEKEAQPLTKNHVILTAISTIGGFGFGYNVNAFFTNGYAIRDSFKAGKSFENQLMSMIFITATFSSLIGGFLSDAHGRKRMLIASGLLYAAGAIAIAFGTTKTGSFAGFSIIGMAIGLTLTIVPVYIAECSPPLHRAKLIVCFEVAIQLGYTFAFGASIAFLKFGIHSWRLIFGLGAIPAFFFIIGMLFLPQSPRWAVMNADEKTAISSMQWLQGSQNGIEAILKDISIKYNTSSSDISRFCQMLNRKSTRQALFLGCILQKLQPLIGINSIEYYFTSILSSVGFQGLQTILNIKLLWSICSVLAACGAIYAVDALGPRKLLLFSTLSLVICIFAIALGFGIMVLESPKASIHVTPPDFFKGDTCEDVKSCSQCSDRLHCGFCFPLHNEQNGSCLPRDMTNPQYSVYGLCGINTTSTDYQWDVDFCPSKCAWVVLVLMCLFRLWFYFGMSPMAWTVNAEIYPTWARSTGMGVSAASYFLFTFLVNLLFLKFTEFTARWGAFLMVGIFSSIVLMMFWKWLPNTKNYPLEEIGSLFDTPWSLSCFKFRIKHTK